MPYQAGKAVTKAYARPLELVVDETRTIELAPTRLGAKANVPKAIRRAHLARPGAIVPLDVEVSQARVRTYVERLGHGIDRKARDARIALDGVKPRAIESQEGRRLKLLATGRSIRTALATNSRAPIRLPYDITKPKVESADLDEAVVILRGSNRLLFFDDAKYVRWFGVATGQRRVPDAARHTSRSPICSGTHGGTHRLLRGRRTPSRFRPGPGNPLGTRWMGLSEPYVGIHGTPDAASIGYSASHGCIRMRIPDAEWLFQHVKVGTPVFIIDK